MKEGWEYKKLGEVCEMISDGDWIESKDQSLKGIRLVQTGNIGLGCFIDKCDKKKYISTETFERLKCTEIYEGDCLVSRLPDPIGRACLLPNLLERAITAVDCSILRFVKVLNPAFFVKYTMSNTYLKEVGKFATGTTRKRISRKNLQEKIVVPVPPLAEQQVIVEELDLLNAIIDKKKEELEELDKLAQSVFYDMFGDPVENEKGWEVKKLGDLASKIGDGLHGTPSYVESSGYYFVNGNNLEQGSVVYNKKTKQVSKEEFEKYYIEFGKQTIFVSINGTIGKLAYYKGEQIILGKSACYINLKANVNKVFVYNILASDYFKKYAMGEKTGSTISNVSLKSIRHFPVPLPPLPLQQQFAARISAIEQMKEKVSASMAEVQTLLAATMDKYFG
mgnify:CR=1 FL=1